MKHKFLSKRLKGVELVVIEGEKWKQMDEEDQYTFLYQLSRTKDNTGLASGQYEAAEAAF